MNKIIISILIYLFFFCSCKKETEVKYIQINNNMDNNIIENILNRQVQYGYAIQETGLDMTSDYNYQKDDYDAIKNLSLEVLKKNGYKFLTDKEFEIKVKTIFKLESKKKDINFLIEYPCEQEKVVYKIDGNYVVSNNNPLFIDIKNRFLLEALLIPELIDYKSQYPLIYQKEEDVPKERVVDGYTFNIIKWKDIPDLAERQHFNEQLLVNRNKYLFNDNKASFDWLKANDEYFLESLVTTFGYTKDKDLLSWVMKKNENRAQDFINENLFVKNCKGELEIREGILKYIEETINKNNDIYFNTLYSYYTDYDNEIWNQFSKNEQDKMLAYLANTFDYLVMKDRELSYKSNGGWSILGNVFYHYNRKDDEKTWNKLVDKFKENKYYGLPHLEEVINYSHNYELGSY